MAYKFGDLLKSLAQKAGIKVDDDTLKKLLGISEVSTLEVPDEFNTAFEQNLLTEASAIANSNIRNKLFAEALNGVDSVLTNNFMPDYEFDDNFKNEFKNEKNTYEKLKKVNTALKDMLKTAKEKSKATKDPADKLEVENLQKEIRTLNDQMAAVKSGHQAEIENYKTANLQNQKEFTLRSVLAGKQLPKNGLAPEINILTAKTLVGQAMAKHNLHFIYDEAGNPVLKQRKDGTDMAYFVDNKEVPFDSFIDGVLAQHKFLQLNDPEGGKQNSGVGNNTESHAEADKAKTNMTAGAEVTNQLAQLGIGATV